MQLPHRPLDVPFLRRALRELPTLPYGVQAQWNQEQLLRHSLNLLPQDPGYLQLAAQLAAWSWQERPLEPVSLQNLQTLQEHVQVLPPEARVLCKVLHGRLQLPQTLLDIHPLLQEALVTDILPPALERLVTEPDHALFWVGQLLPRLLEHGGFAPALSLIERCPRLAELPQLTQRLRAEWAVDALPPEEALPLVLAVDPAVFPHWRDTARAELLLRLAHDAARTKAGELYAGLRRQLPWHVNATLAAHELLCAPLRPAPEQALGQVCILLYSWNKAEDLARTLESLARSTLGGARVLCLDNGSDDATPQVLEQARQQWAARPELPSLETLRLPVNVGAPAARNWLMALPKVRDSAFLAYLDDDIHLPEDWLPQLLGAALHRPEVSAVGCRILRHKRPHVLQAADFNLLAPALCGSGFTDFAERVHVFNNGLGRRDTGLMHYSRACVSVTGCCHLLRKAELDSHGGFDIRFSPSQFDDLERDLRVFEQGRIALYHGGLTVRHVQYSSLQQAADPARQAHIHGNKLKLEHLYDAERLTRMAARCRRLLERDFLDKSAALDELGPGPAV